MSILKTKIFIFLIIIRFPLGQMMRESKMKGGRKADQADWKFLVAIFQDGFHRCSGSLVKPDCIVSAASCYENLTTKSNIHILAGMSNLKKQDEAIVSKAAAVYIHPEYIPHRNDLVVIRLERLIEKSHKTRHIRVRTTEVLPESVCQVAGWGLSSRLNKRGVKITVLYSPLVENVTNFRLKAPDCDPCDLLQADLVTVPYKDCKKKYTQFVFDENSVCTIDPYGQDTCQVDIGGPLVCDNLLSGITSWGVDCTKSKEFPTVHVDVTRHVGWIQAKCNQKLLVPSNLTKIIPDTSEDHPAVRDLATKNLHFYILITELLIIIFLLINN